MSDGGGKTFGTVFLTALFCAAFGQSQWTWRNPFPTGRSLYGVAWGNKFVGVGAFGTVITSPDDSNWSSEYFPVRIALNNMARQKNQLVAVGVGGSILTASLDNVAVNEKPEARRSLRGAAAPESFSVNKSIVRLASPKLTEGAQAAWTLFSVAGKKIRSGLQIVVNKKLEILIDCCPAGAYLLKTECDGVRSGNRFVKN